VPRLQALADSVARRARQIHWFSIFNSSMMVIFLTGLVAMILMRTLRADYARYTARDEDDLEVPQPRPALRPRPWPVPMPVPVPRLWLAPRSRPAHRPWPVSRPCRTLAARQRARLVPSAV